jgi:hypothetical protein
MAFNGSGTFNRIYNWVNDKANGFKIMASRMDNEFDGIATGLSQCITKDGQTTISANIPMANYKFTGLGNGTTRTDSIALGQVQDGQFTYLGTTGGTADAYTLTPSPSITAYATTQQFTAKISATNTTTTPYLQISGIANPTTTAVIKKLSATKTEIAVETSDLLINGIYHFQRNSANDAWIVLNPEKAYFNATNLTKATTTNQGIVYLNNPITIANNATTPNSKIDFGGGVMNFHDGSGQATALPLTKILQSSGSWTAGNDQNGLFSGAKANSTWYFLFDIYNPTTGAVDFGFDTNITATNRPVAYTKYQLLHACKTDSSGNILPGTYFKNGWFWYTTSQTEYSSSAVASANVNLAFYPSGINGLAHMLASSTMSGTTGVRNIQVGSSSTNISINSGTTYGDTYGSSDAGITSVNSSNQIYISTSGTGTSTVKINGFKLNI